MASEDQVNEQIQALQDIASKLEDGNQQEQIRDIPESALEAEGKAAESEGAEVDWGKVTARGLKVTKAGAQMAAAAGNLPTSGRGWVLEGLKTLEGLASGGAISSQAEQIQMRRTAEREMTRLEPFRTTTQYADEMARAGVTLTREEIRAFHDRQQEIGRRRYQNFRNAYAEANTGLVAGVGATGSWINPVTNSQSYQMRNRKIFENNVLQGE